MNSFRFPNLQAWPRSQSGLEQHQPVHPHSLRWRTSEGGDWIVSLQPLPLLNLGLLYVVTFSLKFLNQALFSLTLLLFELFTSSLALPSPFLLFCLQTLHISVSFFSTELFSSAQSFLMSFQILLIPPLLLCHLAADCSHLLIGFSSHFLGFLVLVVVVNLPAAPAAHVCSGKNWSSSGGLWAVSCWAPKKTGTIFSPPPTSQESGSSQKILIWFICSKGTQLSLTKNHEFKLPRLWPGTCVRPLHPIWRLATSHKAAFKRRRTLLGKENYKRCRVLKSLEAPLPYRFSWPSCPCGHTFFGAHGLSTHVCSSCFAFYLQGECTVEAPTRQIKSNKAEPNDPTKGPQMPSGRIDKGNLQRVCW